MKRPMDEIARLHKPLEADRTAQGAINSRRVIAALALTGMTACMSSPRDREVIADPAQIHVEGFAATPGAQVWVDTSPDGATWKSALIDGSQWNIVASQSPTIDPSGNTWYKYTGTIDQRFPWYWSGALSTHITRLRLRSYLRGPNHVGDTYDAAHDATMYTFDESQAAATCAASHLANGHLDIINSCTAAT